MPRLTTQTQERRRERILRGARLAFLERGLRATTHDVARAAGVPVGSIYTYFTDKDDLVRASLLEGNRQETEATMRNLRRGGTVAEQLQRGLAAWYAYTIELPGVAALLAEVWAESTRRPAIRELVARRRERILMVCRFVMLEGIAAGELPSTLDVETRASAMADLLDGFVLEYLERGNEIRLTDLERRALLLLG